MKLKDRVAIITGAASGLGRASARLFAKEGAKVVAADIVADDGEETARLIREDGGEAIFVQVDVRSEADCQRMVKSAVEAFGRLDIMFNNVGLVGTTKHIADLSLEDWNHVMSINMTGTFLGTKYAIPEMLKVGGGAIINTSSVAAILPQRAGSAYATSKAAVKAFTKATAVDYARKNIRANCIIPGPMETAFWNQVSAGDPAKKAAYMEQVSKVLPMGRFADAAEVANVALFLASDESSFMTGAAVAVDGGQLLL